MSDYRRFVSYIYLYENGIKTMNAGFVKVESRNGQCRLSVSLKNVYTGLTRCQVYMFLRFGQDLRGVYIGDVQIRNHGSDWHFRTDTENIAGSGYRLDQMSGMVIRGDDEKFYGTRWDEGDLDIRHFMTEWDESQPEMQAAASISAEEPDVEENEPVLEVVREEKKNEAEPVMENGENFQEQEEEPAQGDELQQEEEVTQEMPVSSDAVAVESEMAVESMAEIEESVENEIETETETGALVSMETDERCRNLNRIFDQCPGMYPFEDDTVEACVRLEPQDIGMLPVDCWSYGSNSFLLQGYYSYRHLILARMKPTEQGNCYILGIPGTRHSRDAFMANMFGFRDFKPIREGDGGNSDFGYWYTFLA